MKRHSFIQKTATGLLGLGAAHQVSAKNLRGKKMALQGYVTQDENRVNLYSGFVKEPIKVLLAADTHLWMNDERGDPFRQYSNRMAKAYNQTSHFGFSYPNYYDDETDSYRFVCVVPFCGTCPRKEKFADGQLLPEICRFSTYHGP